MKNKYGVPYHRYEIQLLNGDDFVVDIGVEDYWGNIQECVPGDECVDGVWEDKVGWGNDADGHIEIMKVWDCETGMEIEPIMWAKNFVWCRVDNYSS